MNECYESPPGRASCSFRRPSCDSRIRCWQTRASQAQSWVSRSQLRRLGGWPVGERAEAVRRSAPRAAWARHAGRGNGTRRRRDAPSSWRGVPVLLAGACPSRARPLGDEARSSRGSQRIVTPRSSSQRSSFAGPGPWSDMVMDPQWGGRPDDNLRALESCVEGSSTPVAFEVDATALAVADPGRPRPERRLDGAPLGYHLGLVADGATKASVGQLVSSVATSPSASPSGAASAVLLR